MRSIAFTIHLACAVACLATAVFAQIETAQPEFLTRYYQGQEAYQEGRHTEAIAHWEAVAADPDGQALRSMVLYNLACCWSLAGQPDSAYVRLDRALAAGFTDHEQLAADPDLDALRRSDPDRFAAFRQHAAAASRRNLRDQTPITVVAFETYTGGTDLSRYSWDAYDHAGFDTLRTAYDLPGIAGDDPAEFARIRRVLAWAATRWSHSGDNECRDANALKLLRRAERGERFRCVEYAILLANSLTALGHPARMVGLARYPVAHGIGRGHVVTEVWSNEFDKWIILDAQNNAWWTAGAGSPLSADECRQLYVTGQGERLHMVSQHADWEHERQARFWAPYFHHLDFETQEVYFGPRIGSHRFEYLAAGVEPELYFQGYPRNLVYTSDRDLAYPTLNQTTVSLTRAARTGESVDVALAHTMPFFASFEVRFDDREDWSSTTDRFTWQLEPGHNVLEVRAVNLAGIRGRASRVVLFSNVGMVN
jgi:hypothetical protein